MQTEQKPKPIPDFPDLNSHQICLNSLNYRLMNPDVPLHPQRVSCTCGREVNIGDDWYTETYDGTLVCWQCSSCSRCGLEGSVSTRKLVSIGGYVLCYRCIRFYGEPKKDAIRATLITNIKSSKVDKKRGKNKKAANKDHANENPQQEDQLKDSHNNYLYSGVNLWQVTHSPENRRLIRHRKYPRPELYIASNDPKLKPQAYYTATQPMFQRMACPSCKTAALGKGSYIVPSISMVYHKSCFRCAACKSIMSNGVRSPGFHFVHCTCNPPLQWCTRISCTQKRMKHHFSLKCQLEPIHPGGRPQMDTRLIVPNSLQDEAGAANHEPTNNESSAESLESARGSGRPPLPSMQPNPTAAPTTSQTQQPQQSRQTIAPAGTLPKADTAA